MSGWTWFQCGSHGFVVNLLRDAEVVGYGHGASVQASVYATVCKALCEAMCACGG